MPEEFLDQTGVHPLISEEEARRIRPVAPGLAIGETQFAELIDTCRHLDRHDRAAEKLIGLTIPL